MRFLFSLAVAGIEAFRVFYAMVGFEVVGHDPTDANYLAELRIGLEVCACPKPRRDTEQESIFISSAGCHRSWTPARAEGRIGGC